MYSIGLGLRFYDGDGGSEWIGEGETVFDGIVVSLGQLLLQELWAYPPDRFSESNTTEKTRSKSKDGEGGCKDKPTVR